MLQRLGKDVTHILYERRHSQRPKDKAADEAELLELYKKLDKVGAQVLVRAHVALATGFSPACPFSMTLLPCAVLPPRL